jgi:ADP-ribosylglycohydrolase
MNVARESRYRGCLVGGAVGDALGAPVEFCSLSEITKQFGNGGVRDFVATYGRLGAITDDTQMTLFTAEGLICAAVKAEKEGKPVLTHGHPSSSLSAAFLAGAIARLIAGYSLRNAIEACAQRLRSLPGAEEVLSAVERAQALAASGSASAVNIEELGKGWVAEEALAIALYSVLTAQDFERAVVLAVNHSGDSDSTRSIAGNLAGAAYGVESIPQRWIENLELRDEIAMMADDLLAVREGIQDLSMEQRARYDVQPAPR